MRHTLPLTALLALGTLGAAPPATDDPRVLVTKLGSDEFADREYATRRLAELGAAALVELRAACKSENPEVVRRAREVLRKVEWRLANEKTLAPTLVELDIQEVRLGDVLSDLSKQAQCEVVLRGTDSKALADRAVTLSTGGKVPFWVAVLKVCDAIDLKIASVAGYQAPDAMALKSPTRPNPWQFNSREVALEARGDAKRRPAAVYGAVLVEAVPFPKGTRTPDPLSALLQVWTEPRLRWEAISGVKLTAATDPAGARLIPEHITGMDQTARIRTPSTLKAADTFRPHDRQAVVRFTTEKEPPGAVEELTASLFGTVRSGLEPLSQARWPEPNTPATGVGVSGIDLTATYKKARNGRFVATVTLTYDPRAVDPDGGCDELTSTEASEAPGNQTVCGLRITDSEGKPYTLVLTSGERIPDTTGRRSITATLELYANTDGQGPPATITLWGTHAQPVEVPVGLKGVPLIRDTSGQWIGNSGLRGRAVAKSTTHY